MVDGLVRLPDTAPLLREFATMRGRLLRSGGEHIEGRLTDDRVHAAVLALSQAMTFVVADPSKPRATEPLTSIGDADDFLERRGPRRQTTVSGW
jgi:hypothetical protein